MEDTSFDYGANIQEDEEETRVAERRYVVELRFRAILGDSYGKRKSPRIRLRKGRKGSWVILSHYRTKKKAFRMARYLRDTDKISDPVAVLPYGLRYAVAVRRR